MNKHEKLIRQIAEEMAKDEDLRIQGFDRWGESQLSGYRESMIEYNIPFARIAVKHMALMYEHGYFSNYEGTEESEDYELWNKNCISEMEERGLIPEVGKEAAEDEG